MRYQIERLLEFCEKRPIKLKPLCKLAGLNYQTIHSKVSNNREFTFPEVDKFSRALGVPIEVFSEGSPVLSVEVESESHVRKLLADTYTVALRDVQAQMIKDGTELGTDAVLSWLRREGSVLRNFDALRERVDLFEMIEPDAQTFKIHRLGHESLSAKYFRVDTTEHFTKVVEQDFSPRLREGVLQDHKDASQKAYTVTDMSIDELIGGVRVRETYQRILAPVKDITGKRLMFNFSRLISKTEHALDEGD